MEAPDLVTRTTTRLLKRPGVILLLAGVLSVLSIIALSEMPFFTSRKALLPQDAEVSRRFNTFLDEFGAASELIVVIEGAERPVLERFASRMAERLEQSPLISQVLEKVDLDFFFNRSYLLAPTKRLKQFESVLEKLIAVPVPEKLDTWDDAFERLESWLDNPPPLSLVDVDLRTAEGGLRMVEFFLQEWLRWMSAPVTPEVIDFQDMLASYGEGARLAAGKGYFSSHDGKMLFLFVRPSNGSEEFDVVEPFIEEVKSRADELRAAFKSEGLAVPEVGLTGLPAVTFEEFTAIQKDIVFIISSAALLILLIIGLWLKSIKWALVVFIPMGLGVLWNIGLIYLTIGHLTLITSAFTAILFGLGVDYGIFLSSRIMEERGADGDLTRAIARGLSSSIRALLTAGGATVLIFGSLVFVPFSGFSDMGLVAACGVLLVLLSTFIVQPAIFYLMPPSTSRAMRHTGGSSAKTPTELKVSRPVNVLILVLALVSMGAGVMAGLDIPFDYDVLAMLPKDSEAARLQRRMVCESDYQGEVVIFTASDIDEARRIAREAAKLDTISQVQTITDLFPPDADKHVEHARRIGATVAASKYLKKIMGMGEVVLLDETMERIESSIDKTELLIEDSEEAAFSGGHKNLVGKFENILQRIEEVREAFEERPERARRRTEAFVQTLMNVARKGFDVLAGWKDAERLTRETLPASYRNRFFSTEGTIAIYAFPDRSVYDPENLERLMKDVYGVSKQATGFPTTHQVFSHLAVDSFRQGTVVAVIVATIWILLIVRNLSGFIVAMLPLLVGGGWMLGLLALVGTRFSYANIIALPLVMGLAVDYGVWYTHRRREHPDLASWQVALLAGRAILLAACTTLAGLGAITLASYRGISTMGMSVTIGLSCCVVAALLVSPAIGDLIFRRKS